MKIVEDRQLGGWRGETQFRGTNVTFSIDAELSRSNPKDIASQALAELEHRWPEVVASLLGHPFSLYSESWAEPPAVSKEEFLRRLLITSLSIGEDTIFAYFSDGGLFAGHIVSIALIGKAAPIAALEG